MTAAKPSARGDGVARVSSFRPGLVHNAAVTTAAASRPRVAAGPRPKRRPARGYLAVIVTGVVLVLAAGGWWVWSGASAERIEVSWKPTCTGTEVSRYKERSVSAPSDELAGEYVIDARPGFQCTISLTVHNSSGSSAHLTSIEAPFLGPDGGAEVMGAPVTTCPPLRPTISMDSTRPTR
jgi:hypothetical protein